MSLSRPPAGWSRSRAGRKKGIAALPGWKLFRFGGTEVYIDASWPIFFVVSAVIAASAVFPQRWAGAFETVPSGYADLSHWAAGLLAAALILGSILAHELAHFAAAKRLGMAVPAIRLYVFGDIVEPMHEPRSPGHEFRIALAGPIVSAAFGAVGVALARVFPEGSMLQAVAQVAGEFNLLVAVVSLLPGFPLDGGRLLRAALWKRTSNVYRATQEASALGVALSVGSGLFGFFAFMSIRQPGLGAGMLPLFGLWALLVAWFLWSASRWAFRDSTHRERLRTIAVHRVTRPFTQEPFAHDASVEEVWQVILADKARPPCWAVADASGHITARITRRQVAEVSSDRRADVCVAEIARQIESTEVLDSHVMLDTVLDQVRREHRGFYVVRDEDRIVGWVYADDLVQGKRLGSAG